jgi:hypothetical protein
VIPEQRIDDSDHHFKSKPMYGIMRADCQLDGSQRLEALLLSDDWFG